MTAPPRRRFILSLPTHSEEAAPLRALAAALRHAGHTVMPLLTPTAEDIGPARDEFDVLVLPWTHRALAPAAAGKACAVLATDPWLSPAELAAAAPARVLVAVSPALFPPSPDLPANAVFTGFLVEAAESVDAGAGVLDTVIALERAGVLVTAAAFHVAPGGPLVPLARRLAEGWPAPMPLVLFDEDGALALLAGRPGIQLVRGLPLASVFQYAATVAHDGAPAAAAAALHGARPQVVVARDAAARRWADALVALGVAQALESPAWPELLPYAVQDLPNDVRAVRRVAECAARVRAEDGPARAVAELERLCP